MLSYGGNGDRSLQAGLRDEQGQTWDDAARWGSQADSDLLSQALVDQWCEMVSEQVGPSQAELSAQTKEGKDAMLRIKDAILDLQARRGSEVGQAVAGFSLGLGLIAFVCVIVLTGVVIATSGSLDSFASLSNLGQ